VIVGGVGGASERLGVLERVFQSILDEKYLGVHFAIRSYNVASYKLYLRGLSCHLLTLHDYENTNQIQGMYPEISCGQVCKLVFPFPILLKSWGRSLSRGNESQLYWFLI
jgi:hypothetical protein